MSKFNAIVSKFGGTSMADFVAMKRSASIGLEHHANVIVVSATSGTTDKIVLLGKEAENSKWEGCQEIIDGLLDKHLKIAKDIGVNDKITFEVRALIDELSTLAKGVHLLRDLTPKAKDNMLSIGERLSSLLFCEVVKELAPGKEVILLDARKVLITDSHYGRAAPQIQKIREKCDLHVKLDTNRVYVTQGFIGSTEDGHTTTLGRGGSDYSAALLAEGMRADLLEIWTDVAGIATTDPRICPKAKPIHEISYLEASEMAQYGAKILHPTTLIPAMRSSIAVFVGSSYGPNEPGTWIKNKTEEIPSVRAIAKRDNQALLIIRTPAMLNTYGFLGKIFEVFRHHKISVDCVTTSEISVAVTVDHATLDHREMFADLNVLGEVIVEKNLALISIIGNKIHATPGVGHRIFSSLQGVNVRMVCLGASEHNFCFLVGMEEANSAIQKLHKHFVEEEA